ncbi:carboxylesteras-like protein [Periconia macrospinosa]|uniref:Carboxylesteras-like protein n=1 Tax=Periconia macrospinosa TaxID=97972 RepID=A0A2V1DVK0_9PLEO|nr:carboxylesteras-like protein [Periconia macrospinosa]
MATTFKHPDLGEVKAKPVDGALQFLGLKYASLQDRFAAPQLYTNYNSSTSIDATKFGPPPVSTVGAINNEFAFIQKSLPLPEVPTHSDTEGLNLNITVPLGKDGSALQSDAKLPVYVFVHGGAFAFGSNWYPHYDPAALVRLSVEMGKPVIGVTINYRLGIPGFLTSKELRDAGYKANNGFHDQRTAMKWIKKYIGGFGGDPEEITAVGESAGALSVVMLLTSQEPLMKRCLCTGGALFLFKPLPDFLVEATYQKVVEALGLKDKSPEERVKALVSLPADDLWQKVPPGTLLSPIADGETTHSDPSFASFASQEESVQAQLPGRKWLSGLMLGDSALDSSVFAYMGMDPSNIATRFITSATSTLSAHLSALTTLLTSYNITPTTPDNEALLSILRFTSEITFYASARAVAQGWPKSASSKVYLYHLNEGTPWEGRFQGEAVHIFDVALLFQNYNGELEKAQRKIARGYGEDFVRFVNGEEPWKPVEEGKFSARVYGPVKEGKGVEFVESGEPEKVGRSETVLKLGEEVGFDTVMDVLSNFLQGR